MSRYTLEVKVTQSCQKLISLEVAADSFEEAEEKAREALKTYPREIMEDGIYKMLTKKSRYEEPTDVLVLAVREDKRFGKD